MKHLYLLFLLITTTLLSQTDQKIYDIIDAVSEARIKADVKTLTDSRNTIFVTLKFSTTLNPNTLEQITLDTSYSATRY